MKKYITVLSVLSCIAVVYLHINDCFWNFSYENYWISANIIESIFYFAVPVFFMISGCTLIDYRNKYSTKIYFKKRINKTLIPFIIWSMLALLYMIFIQSNTSMLDGGVVASVRHILGLFFNAQILNIYWFFLPLFSIYLCIPALSLIPENVRQKIFRYLLIATFIFNISIPFLFRLLKIAYNEENNLEILMVGGYLFYALAGYYIDQYPIRKKFRYIIYILGILGLLVHMGGTWLASYYTGNINSTFKGYLNMPCVMYSVSIFVLFKYIDTSKFIDRLHRVTKFFADSSFGVYLMHWFIIDIFLRNSTVDYRNIFYRLFGGIGVFLTKLIHKIPVLERIVP